MNIIDAEISQEKMLDLFRNIHNIYRCKPNYNGTHVVERICKCYNLDVKITLRMYITYSGDDVGNFMVNVKILATTNCVNLRKTRNYFGDGETVIIAKDFSEMINDSDYLRQYKKLVDEIIDSYNVFKVCRHCRILYQDPRQDIEPDYPCVNCLFDQVFYFRDLDCVVCKDSIQKTDMNFTLTCGHTFHTGCIMKTFIQMKKRECPLCRESDSHDII
jgi:hypothetical protein